MRLLALLAAASLLTLPVSCTKRIIVRGEDPASAEGPDDEEDDEEPEPEPDPEPEPSDPLLIDLGEVETGTDVTFEIPEGALGFNIIAEGRARDFNPNAPFGIERISDPNGKAVHTRFTPKGGTNPTSLASFDTIAAASVPQGDGVSEVLAGTWTVRFGVANSSKKAKLKGTVRVQSSGDGGFYGGALDLHVHVPAGLRINGSPVDPGRAGSSAALNDRIDIFFDVASQLLGIDRGEVVFHEARSALADLDGFQDIYEGFSVSRGMEDGTKALHLLVTNAIRLDGEPIAAGIAPGIPGAASVFGRGVSGIIVTPHASAEEDALTIAHEMGHFVGLNHTSEFNGRGFDPLSDTPECPSASYNYSDLMRCPDRKNIMFPAGPVEGPIALSPMQTRVVRGSPIYTALRQGGSKTMVRREAAPLRVERQVRLSGRKELSLVERELSMGFCGLTPLDPDGMVQRHGREQAIAQLRAAAADEDLVPYIRGRARLTLRQLEAE